MDPVNLKQLAKQLNLSVSTVSKAFRNSYDINITTRNRILSLARELNYQPNPLASSLRTQKSRTIAVIIPEVANTFFSLAINGIESIARDAGYHVLIYLTHENSVQEKAFTRHLQSGRVDGVIMSLSDGSCGYEHLEDLKSKGIPVVFFDRVYEAAETTRVTTNDFESGYLATKHLLERGCQRPAHLTVGKKISIVEKRMEGYLAALKELAPSTEALVLKCTNNHQENYKLVKRFILSKKPDGIFSAFEKLALHCYQVSAETRLRIPQDLKLISFSNLETASLLNPSLSTITQPAFEIGRKAAEVLFDSISNENTEIATERIVLNSVLNIRASSG
jgi:LacI family transcriptional regulator